MKKTGIVIKSTGSWFFVRHENSIVQCKIKGAFRMKGMKATNPVAVGDRVDFDIVDSNTAVITHLHDRKNYIVRKAINLSKQVHVIAANIDQVFLMATIVFPVTTTTFIDRFLATAEAYRIPARIIFNKTDLYTDEQHQQLDKLVSVYTKIGYDCISASVTENRNIDVIKQMLKDKVSMISGHSGVGKSALIKLIDPSLEIKIGELSEYHKSGKHTTTFSEMFELRDVGYIIDTPGIKAFGMVDMKTDPISHYFPEMFKHSKNCQYANCTHTHEPQCAVKVAIENGEISVSRYESYLSMLFDDEGKYRTKGYL